MEENNLRIDKWLWAVRIFKTRSLASDACRKGKVCIAGEPVKPSRVVKLGDIIEVKQTPLVYTYKVKGLLGQRLSASLVADYVENITTESELEKLKVMKENPLNFYRQRGTGRPTKKDRRTIDRLKS